MLVMQRSLTFKSKSLTRTHQPAVIKKEKTLLERTSLEVLIKCRPRNEKCLTVFGVLLFSMHGAKSDLAALNMPEQQQLLLVVFSSTGGWKEWLRLKIKKDIPLIVYMRS